MSLKNNDTTIIEIVDLNPKEVQLLMAIRHIWRYGELVVQVRDGLPYRMRRAVEFIDIPGDSSFLGEKKVVEK